MTAKPLSEALEQAKIAFDGETTNFREFLARFGDRGTAFLLFLIALPAALPVPAIGICVIIAPPLLFLTFQQMLGRRTIWLPKKVAEKPFSTASLINVLDKAIPMTQKVEIFLKPRLSFLTTHQSCIIIGFFRVHHGPVRDPSFPSNQHCTQHGHCHYGDGGTYA